METISDNRFDPNHATQLLLDIAHEQSLEALLQKLVHRGVERGDITCAQVWLIDKGDRCTACPRRTDCADQSRCLHLVASRGASLCPPGPEVFHSDQLNVRMPLGLGLLGKIVHTQQQITLNDLDEQPAEQG